MSRRGYVVLLLSAPLAAGASAWLLDRPLITTAASEPPAPRWWPAAIIMAGAVLVAWLASRRWADHVGWTAAASLSLLATVAAGRHAGADFADGFTPLGITRPDGGHLLGALANPRRWAGIPTLVYAAPLRDGVVLHRRCFAGRCDARLFEQHDRTARTLDGDALHQYWFAEDDPLVVSAGAGGALWTVRGSDAVAAFERRGHRFVPRQVLLSDVSGTLGPPRWTVWSAWLALGLALPLLLGARRLSLVIDRAHHCVEATLDERGWLLFPDAPPRRYEGSTRPGPVVVWDLGAGNATIYRDGGRDAPTLHPGTLDQWLGGLHDKHARALLLAFGVLAWGAAPLVTAATLGFL